jgi:hypothetical protein
LIDYSVANDVDGSQASLRDLDKARKLVAKEEAKAERKRMEQARKACAPHGYSVLQNGLLIIT